MTPLSNASAKLEFTLAAKKDDIDGMAHILSSTPEHMSPIDHGVLFFAFNDALREGRMRTVEFLLTETKLSTSVPTETLAAQAHFHGRTIDISHKV